MKIYRIILLVLATIFVLCVCIMRPDYIVFVVVGFLLGFVISCYRQLIGLLRCVKLKHIIRFIAIVVVLLIVGGILEYVLRPMHIHKVAVKKVESVRHRMVCIYEPDNNIWLIESEMVIANIERIDSLLNEDPLLKGFEILGESVPKDVYELMSICGWKHIKIVNGYPHFEKTMMQESSSRVLSVYSVDTIHLPKVGYRLLQLIPDEASDVVLEVPRYFVTRTYPHWLSRGEIPDENAERIVIPIGDRFEYLSEIKIEILSPLFRNAFCQKVVVDIIWPAIKWLVLFVCAIIVRDIVKKIIKPITKRIFSKKDISCEKEDKSESNAEREHSEE